MNQSMDVIEKIKELIDNNSKDTDLTSEVIIDVYSSASLGEKEIINKFIMCLTGIQFDTILKRLGIQ